jgi:hypothetical protein
MLMVSSFFIGRRGGRDLGLAERQHEPVRPVEEGGAADDVDDLGVVEAGRAQPRDVGAPNASGVSARATDAATTAFHVSSPRSASTLVEQALHVGLATRLAGGGGGVHRRAEHAAVVARGRRGGELALGAADAARHVVEDVEVGERARARASGSRASSRKYGIFARAGSMSASRWTSVRSSSATGRATAPSRDPAA